ncbi:MAG: hypothetical protein WBB23_06810 [Desulforhopalus sp.]
MKRQEAIKEIVAKIEAIENGPEVEFDEFLEIDLYPKSALPTMYKALEQFKNMSDKEWEKACQFND